MIFKEKEGEGADRRGLCEGDEEWAASGVTKRSMMRG